MIWYPDEIDECGRKYSSHNFYNFFLHFFILSNIVDLYLLLFIFTNIFFYNHLEWALNSAPYYINGWVLCKNMMVNTGKYHIVLESNILIFILDFG